MGKAPTPPGHRRNRTVGACLVIDHRDHTSLTALRLTCRHARLRPSARRGGVVRHARRLRRSNEPRAHTTQICCHCSNEHRLHATQIGCHCADEHRVDSTEIGCRRAGRTDHRNDQRSCGIGHRRPARRPFHSDAGTADGVPRHERLPTHRDLGASRWGSGWLCRVRRLGTPGTGAKSVRLRCDRTPA